MLASLLLLLSALIAHTVQDADPGRRSFEARCARCHGADANGGEMGPPIALRLATLDDQQLSTLIRDGLPARGMPPNPVAESETPDLLKFLRTIQRTSMASPVAARKIQVHTTGGTVIDGRVLGEGFEDLQVRTDDGGVHLLRRAEGAVREVTSTTDWPTYNGDPRGNR